MYAKYCTEFRQERQLVAPRRRKPLTPCEQWKGLVVRHQLFINDQTSSALVPINLFALAKHCCQQSTHLISLCQPEDLKPGHQFAQQQIKSCSFLSTVNHLISMCQPEDLKPDNQFAKQQIQWDGLWDVLLTD